MKLKDDWKRILKSAWSIRLIIIATIFSIAEIGLPLYSDSMPHGLFATLSGVATVGAMIARILVQRKFEHD